MTGTAGFPPSSFSGQLLSSPPSPVVCLSPSLRSSPPRSFFSRFHRHRPPPRVLRHQDLPSPSLLLNRRKNQTKLPSSSSPQTRSFAVSSPSSIKSSLVASAPPPSSRSAVDVCSISASSVQLRLRNRHNLPSQIRSANPIFFAPDSNPRKASTPPSSSSVVVFWSSPEDSAAGNLTGNRSKGQIPVLLLWRTKR